MTDEKLGEALLRRLNGEAPPIDAADGMSVADLIRWERALDANAAVMFDLLRRLSVAATPEAIALLQQEATDLINHVQELAQPPAGTGREGPDE